MNNNRNLKIIFIFSAITLSLVSLQAGPLFDIPFKQLSTNNTSPVILKYRLPAPRALIPRSIINRVATKQENLTIMTRSLQCNTNTSICNSFEGNITGKNVLAWMGFEFKNQRGKYFIATYGQKAEDLGNGLYSTEQWDKRHLWLNIGKDSVPLAIQTRFVAVDDESKNEWYTVDYLGYKMANSSIDYANYRDNMSMSSLVLLVNPKTKTVLEYHLEYYDENDEYVGDYEIKVGDEVKSYFLAFNKSQNDAQYLFSLENITPVTSPITFSYEELYPGKDFNCTNCGELDLAQVEFKYMFESYSQTRSNFSRPLSLANKDTSNNNSNASTENSVPISGTWILFFLVPFIAMLQFKKFIKTNEK